MSTAEIKLDLFRKLDGLSEDKLKELYGYVLNFITKSSSYDFWDELSESEQNLVNEGIADLDNGNTYSYEEVRANIKKKHKI